MNSPRITFTPRADATAEAELNVLANLYRFILDCHAKKIGAEPDSCNDTAIVRNTEGVSHVEQRPEDHQRSHSQQYPSRKIPASADT